MTIQVLSNHKNSPSFQLRTNDSQSLIIPEQKREEIHHSKHEKSNISTINKVGIYLTSITGVGAVMASVLAKKGFSLKITDVIKAKPKDWGLFKVLYKEDEIPQLVLKLAGGSVIGGLVGGAVFDKKENFNAKIREGIIQFVGNVTTPLVAVWGGMKLFKKVEPQILKHLPSNKVIKGIPGVLATLASLTAGIIGGNKVGNLINEKIFHVKDNRKIKLSDMSPHIDDLCVAVSIAGANFPSIPRVIPLALLVAGVSTGLAEEKPERLHQHHRVHNEING